MSIGYPQKKLSKVYEKERQKNGRNSQKVLS